MATPPVFTSGSVLTAAQMNAVGLWLVKTDTITSGTSKEITGAFSSDFDNYKIVLSNIQGSTTDSLWLRLGTTATGVYYWAGQYINYGGGATVVSASPGNQFDLGGVITSGGKGGGTIEIQGPNLAAFTCYQAQFTDPRTTGGSNGRLYSGFVNNTTQYTSFTILTGVAGATFTSCNVAVYGYRKA